MQGFTNETFTAIKEKASDEEFGLNLKPYNLPNCGDVELN